MLQRAGGIVANAVRRGGGAAAALAAPSAAPLRNFAKDLDFVLAAAASAKLQLPTATAARQAVRRATAIGKDDADWAYVSELHDGKIEAAAADPRARVLATLSQECLLRSLNP